ncbi:ATP-binding protein [Pseudodesulfovibrio portus]|uniref:histidine kinase n=1 Tax=Pseudodesulfovibrio portus TaxID=231439 RepID=A0ABM8APG5_9BACT|nr:ATP-binding protein [Pseudodesulfovibrio portus]BDQ33256.1 hypothetical protein JCM14722_07980 [Pseudodesulfovibrio portus]
MTTGPRLSDILRLLEPDGAFAYAVAESPDREGVIAGANRTACSLLGYSPDEILSLSPADIVPDLNELAGTGPFETGDATVGHSLTTRNGDILPVEIRSHVLRIDDRELNIVSFRDNSRRSRSLLWEEQGQRCLRTLKRLSRAFDESEQALLEYVLRESLDMTGSSLGYIYFLNPGETEMTLKAWINDHSPKGVETTPPPHCGPREAGFWGAAMKQRSPVISNCCEATPGSPFSIDRHLCLPIIDNGRIVLIAGVANKKEDYTEADLAHLSLPIEGVWLIIQRKRMEAELVDAIKNAERASRAKSQFLANMSHELRTPLNGIMGMTQLLMGTEVNNEQKEYLTLSMEAAQHLSKVMTSLLDLTAIESGAVTITPVNFSLPDTLESIIKPLALQAAHKSLTLVHELHHEVPALINGDEKKLRQIIINLIYNAIKFTEEGEVALTVTRTATTSGLLGDMAELRFTVTDTGIGIPEDKLESIFERFVLGEDYLTKRYGGTGLGLSISRELANAMGGDISVRSTPGRGSTFTLTLPFLLRDAKGGSCTITDPTGGPSRPLNILVAEDEQVNALVTSGILKKRGHSVTVVGNGQHAIDALMRNPFDLVLMDVQMPVINGLEVTEIIRRGAAENVPRDIPIVGLTAYATDADRKLCLDAGMNFVVTKPFEAGELLASINRCTAA